MCRELPSAFAPQPLTPLLRDPSTASTSLSTAFPVRSEAEPGPGAGSSYSTPEGAPILPYPGL